jgi:hypothetical protein
MSLPGKNDFEKLAALVKKTHKEQVVWFLNGFVCILHFPSNSMPPLCIFTYSSHLLFQ